MQSPSRSVYILIFWSAMLLVCGIGAAVTGHPGSALQGVDERVLRWVSTIRTEQLDLFFSVATLAGSTIVLTPLTVATAISLVVRNRKREALFLVSALLGASYLAGVAKIFVARPRPSFFAIPYRMPTGFSFPSSHATQIVAFVAALLVLTKVLRGRIPPAAWLAGLSAVAVVCFSRLYLQVHYPTDVVAGAICALLWVLGLKFLLLTGPPQQR